MSKDPEDRIPARLRLVICALFGLAAATIVVLSGYWEFAPITMWDIAAIIYFVWVWTTVWPMNSTETKKMALREDPGRASTEVLLIIASIASLIAVAFLIVEASHSSGILKAINISLGLASVVISWAVVHTTYALKYASLYYGHPEGGVDFNGDQPEYSDFAYLAFTLGMTFQVSDTALKTKSIRTTALKHVLLSYLFGTIIIATTINTVASLAQ